jgi:hypothetical protein
MGRAQGEVWATATAMAQMKPSVDASAGLRSSQVRMMRVTVAGVNQAPSTGGRPSRERVCIGQTTSLRGTLDPPASPNGGHEELGGS